MSPMAPQSGARETAAARHGGRAVPAPCPPAPCPPAPCPPAPCPALFLLLALGVLGSAASAAQAANGEIEIRVVDDESGALIPARMHLKDPQGKPVIPPGSVSWKDHFVFPGKIILKLRPGQYSFEIERGPEYRVRRGYFILKSGDLDNKELRLPRFIDMSADGWWSGDLHIHRSPEDVELLMLAEDLHIAPVITWWNKRNAWSGQTPADSVKRFADSRFYDVLGGEDERAGGALLYFNLKSPLPIADAGREHPSPAAFLKLARQQPGAHIDIEKPFWWDAPVWLASGQVDSIGLAHNHMHRDGVLDNEAWGRPRDRTAYPPLDGNGHYTTDLYYRILNSGIRIPPSAGSASGVLPNPVGYNRVYVHVEGELTWEKWWAGLRAGQVTVTNGPLLRPRVNGQLPGHVFRAEAGQQVKLDIQLNLALRDKVDYLEVIQNGKVAHQVRLDQYAAAGGSLPSVTFDESGWMLIRAVCSTPQTFRFGSTGPYYVEIGGAPRISREAAEFFSQWVHDRAGKIVLTGEAREEVIQFHRAARDFWHDRVSRATAP